MAYINSLIKMEEAGLKSIVSLIQRKPEFLNLSLCDHFKIFSGISLYLHRYSRFNFDRIHFYLKGIYNYPNDAACNVAMKAVREFLEKFFEVNRNHSKLKTGAEHLKHSS